MICAQLPKRAGPPRSYRDGRRPLDGWPEEEPGFWVEGPQITKARRRKTKRKKSVLQFANDGEGVVEWGLRGPASYEAQCLPTRPGSLLAVPEQLPARRGLWISG